MTAPHLILGSLHPTLSCDGLAALLNLAPSTIRKNVSHRPETLPPVVKIGKRRIWLTALTLAWLADEGLRKPVEIDIRELPACLDDRALASLLHLSPKSIASMKFRASDALPRPGRHGWETTAVFRWLVNNLVGVPRHTTIHVSAPVFRLAGKPFAVLPAPLPLAEMLLAPARHFGS
jgi:hypothetical protein